MSPQVKAQLRYWMNHFAAQIKAVLKLKQLGVDGLNLALIARAILGRPMVDPGGETVLYTKRRALHKTPAASTDLRVCEHMYRCLCLRSYRATALPDTDTKSYTDMHKIHRAIEKDVSQVASKLSEEQCVEVNPMDTVKLCWCDGQAFEREGGLIKRTNGRNRQFVPLDGPFHEATHADFAYVETWWQVFYCWAVGILGYAAGTRGFTRRAA